MGVAFLLGRAGTGKTHTCQSELVDALRAGDATPRPLILLVPEQAAFQSERALALRAPRRGLIDAEVCSFKRLLRRAMDWRADVQILSRAARRLVLRRLAQGPGEILHAFGATARSAGFLDQLGTIFDELLSEALTPEQLRAAAPGLEPGARRRVEALAELLGRYREWLGAQRVDEAAALELVRAHIRESDWLRGARVWVDGFAGFTAQELETVVELARVASRMTIALLSDAPPAPPSAADDELDLFRRTQQTHRLLRARLREAGVTIDGVRVLSPNPPARFARAPALARLEHALAFPLQRPVPAAAADAQTPPRVNLLECPTLRDEFRAAARLIRRVVPDSGGAWRFRDFAVIARDLEPICDLAADAFEEYDLPYFVDRRRSIAPHALVCAVDALLEALGAGYAPEVMVRLLRTGLIAPRAAAEELENWIAANEVRGAAVWHAARWMFVRASDSPHRARLDALRLRIAAALEPLRLLAGPGATAREWGAALHQALLALGVPRRLARWIDAAAQRNEIEAAETHRLAWDALRETLDNLHDWLGDTRLALRELRDVLASSLRETEIGLAPPMLDQVLISSIERSRHPEVRHAWIVAFNEGVFPQPPRGDPILSADERSALAAAGLAGLAPRRANPLDERLLAYIAVTRPSERLTISFARTSADGAALLPSPLLTELQLALPELRIEADAQAPPSTLRELATVLALPAAHRFVPECRAAQHALRSDPAAAAGLRLLLRGDAYDNTARPARAAGSQRNISFSHVDYQLQCPFKRFVARELRPERTPRPMLLAQELGSFAHDVLSRVVRDAIDSARPVQEIPDEQWLAWLRQAGADALAEQGDLATRRPHRHFPFALQLERLADVVLAHAARWRAGSWRPLHVEHDLSLELALPDGAHARIVGRADRIDVLERDAQRFYLVYDYKPRAAAFATQPWLLGPSLQSLSYLLILLPGGRAGGALLAPLCADEQMLGNRYFERADDAAQRLYQYRPRGVFLRDLARTLDHALGCARPSPVIAAQLRKDGEFADKGSVDALSDEALAAKLALAQRTLEQAAAGIAAGQTSVSPLVVQRTLVCTHCEYGAICRFEPSFGTPRPVETLGAAARTEPPA